jgi:hypothetical protein
LLPKCSSKHFTWWKTFLGLQGLYISREKASHRTHTYDSKIEINLYIIGDKNEERQ